MHVRPAIAFVALFGTMLVEGPARASQDAHEIGDDVRVVVDGQGVASEAHRLRWRVLRGPLVSFDLGQVDPHAVVEPDVAISSEEGHASTAHASRRDDGTVRVSVDDPRALFHGDFAFEVRWRVDLVAAGRVVRDGATLRLTWSAPPTVDGLDEARVTFDLPAAPEPPRPIVASSGLVDATASATYTRGPQRDGVELFRAHVPRGESVTWTLRVDPHALSKATDLRGRAFREPAANAEPERWREALFGCVLAALAFGFGALVRYKTRTFAARCLLRGSRSLSLLPFSEGPRSFLAGVSFASAIGLEAVGMPTWGAVCIAIAVLAAALRAPFATPAVRGPGRWQPLRPEQAFTCDSTAEGALDIDTPRGRTEALRAGLLVAVVAVVMRRLDIDGAWLTVLDAAVLVPIFLTGRASQMPPRGAPATAPWLAAAFREMRSLAGVHVAPWGRVVLAGTAADELRLIAMPQTPLPGLTGLEVGLAWASTPVSWAATPEVLARVLEGSPAALRLVGEVPRAKMMLGRRPDERVMRLSPRAPTRSSTVALVGALAHSLTDRRVAPPSPPSLVGRGRARPERRKPSKTVATAPADASA